MYTAISATSRTLSEYLRQRLAAVISFFADNTMRVTLNSPQEMENGTSQGLSVWLYHVARDEQRLNAPPERLSRTELRRVPLPVRLHYLITPIVDVSFETASSPVTEQIILGRVLQAMHDHPVLRGTDLQGDLAGTDVELYARLESLGLEEQTRVWDALDRSYQLSVSYEVSVVHIHSALGPDAVRPVEVTLPELGVITATTTP